MELEYGVFSDCIIIILLLTLDLPAELVQPLFNFNRHNSICQKKKKHVSKQKNITELTWKPN